MWIVRSGDDAEREVDDDGVAWVEVSDEGALWFTDDADEALAIFAPGAWNHAFHHDAASD